MTNRAKFIAEASKNPKKLAAWAWDATMMASTHDPDHADDIVDLRLRVSRLEAVNEAFAQGLIRIGLVK